MNKILSTVVLTTAIAVTGFTLTATSATAVELFSASVDQVVRGAEGDVIEVATIPVPPEFVGESCSVMGETVNQESVHPGNDLLVVGSITTLVIPNFEDEGFIRHQAGELASLPEVIRVFVRLGPDGVSSGGFRVVVECDDLGDLGATTTVPDTTVPDTTVPPDTTTPGTTSPETTVPTDTTVPPETTVPETTAPPATTVPDTTVAPTTTTPTPTTIAGDTGSGDDDDGGQLAATGSTSALLAVTAALLIAAGASLAATARRLA